MTSRLERGPEHKRVRSGAGYLLPLFFLFVAAFFLLSGCEALFGPPTPTPVPPTVTPTPTLPPPTAPAGWTGHQKDSFQITLPASWQEIQMGDAALKQAIDAASTDNPHLADTLRGILTSGQNKNFEFYAVDSKSPGVIVTNVSVARTTVPPGTTAAQAAQQFASSLPQLLKGAKLVEVRGPLEINGLHAGEVDYDLPLVNPAGQVVTVRGVQTLFVPNSGNGYVVTVTGDASQANQFVPVAREIAQSFWLATP